jgi:outer membrane biogenesis lipoprotein LolB
MRSQLLIAAIAAALLTACSERPPRHDPEAVQAYNVENAPSPLVERTLNQGESDRMSY